VSSFEEWSVLEVGVGLSFPLGNGPNKSFPREDPFYPSCTMISVGGMAQLGEWSRLSNQGQTFPRVDSFSPGCTMTSVGGMAQLGEWSRLRN
jgi:hypothetical protein